MSPLLPLLLAFGAGLVLGLFYFGGLWLTVRKLPRCRHPVPILVASFAVRTAVGGFYVVTGGHWERALVCLGGFLAGRFALTSRLRPESVPPVPRDKEGVGS